MLAAGVTNALCLLSGSGRVGDDEEGAAEGDEENACVAEESNDDEVRPVAAESVRVNCEVVREVTPRAW